MKATDNKSPQNSLLLTDLYQLYMMQAYLDEGLTETAVFEFFVRRLPANRSYLVAAGLEQALDFLENLSFSAEELEWLAGTGRFSPALIDYLSSLEFTGDVDAMPEGTVFFENEPVFRVIAPLPIAQLVETRLVNLLQFQTLIASKAARMVMVAQGKQLVDFGLRRAHGAEAGLLAPAPVILPDSPGPRPCLPVLTSMSPFSALWPIRSFRHTKKRWPLLLILHGRDRTIWCFCWILTIQKKLGEKWWS